MISIIRRSSLRCFVGRKAFHVNVFPRAGVPVLLGLDESGNRASLDNRLPLSKIVATIGPASEQLPMLSQVVDAGMRIMRINFSHATYEEADLRVSNLRLCCGINHRAHLSQEEAAAEAACRNITNLRAVMLDTQGPEIRTGSFPEGTKEVTLSKGDEVVLTTDERHRHDQSRELLWVSYEKLLSTVQPGSVVLLDDGAVALTVKQLNHGGSAQQVLCEVQNTGSIGNKKGVNLPGLEVDLPAMCEKDKEDIKWGIKNSVDFIAASFVRKASDVVEIRDYVQQQMQQMHSDDSSSGLPAGRPQKNTMPQIISKIESIEALQHFDDILRVSDAIMVARGDLAVEIPMETLSNVQKEIVARCNAAGKPVIVATQMLETMQKNPRPTRAECTDVANAIRDGADAVMLSGESAKGRYPVESVALMKRIVDQAELSLMHSEPLLPRGAPDLGGDTSTAMAYSAVQAAHSLRKDPHFACMVVMMSTNVEKSTALAQRIASFRPHVPVLCVVPNQKVGRQLQIYRSLHPVLMVHDTDRQETTQVLLHLRRLGLVQSKHHVLIVRQRSANHEISLSLCTV